MNEMNEDELVDSICRLFDVAEMNEDELVDEPKNIVLMELAPVYKRLNMMQIIWCCRDERGWSCG